MYNLTKLSTCKNKTALHLNIFTVFKKLYTSSAIHRKCNWKLILVCGTCHSKNRNIVFNQEWISFKFYALNNNSFAKYDTR